MTPQTTGEFDAVVRREHGDPHSVLGPHAAPDGVVIRALRPAAESITVVLDRDGETIPLRQVHPGGLFEGLVEGAALPLHYRLEVDYGGGRVFTLRDPYSFTPTLGELDLHLIGEGRHEELYDRLGARVREHDGVAGTAFAVWAPAARAVSVIGDFNSWDGRLHAMRSLGASGIWELFLPEIGPGERYKFEILTQTGELLLKADPYALATEVPPKNASVVFKSTYEWDDGEFVEARRDGQPLGQPISIYEIHLGSWRLN